jgi:hypothetical protein
MFRPFNVRRDSGGLIRWEKQSALDSLYRQTDRERERECLGECGSERHYNGGRGVLKTIFAVLKVPRQCPLVLLVGVRLVFGINSLFNFNEVRGEI